MARVLKGLHSFSCTPRVLAFIHQRNEPYLTLPSQPKLHGTHLPTPEGWKAELALSGWLVTYRYENKCPAPGIEPGHGRSSQY